MTKSKMIILSKANLQHQQEEKRVVINVSPFLNKKKKEKMITSKSPKLMTLCRNQVLTTILRKQDTCGLLPAK